MLLLILCSVALPSAWLFSAPAHAAAAKLMASDDTFVQGGASGERNNGSSQTLLIKDSAVDNDAEDRRIFLKFDLSTVGALAVSQATLHFTVTELEALSSAKLRVANTGDTWSEQSLTWSSQLAPRDEFVKDITVGPGPQTLDLTAYVRDQLAGDKQVSLVLLDTSAAGRGISIASTESGAGGPSLELSTESEPPLLPVPRIGKNSGPFFQIACEPQHRSHSDPIVFPGQEHATHEHQFFGNTTTDEMSTQATLLRGGSSCVTDPQDTAAYWAPALYDESGKMQIPRRVRAYYYANSNDKTQLQSFPAGLRVIAGDPKATANQPDGVIRWLCRDKNDQGKEKALAATDPPRCNDHQYLALMVRFPNCVARYSDGMPMLDSSDHRRHMAYADAGQKCPATHPIRVPKLRLSIIYEAPGYSGGSFTLGGTHGGHHMLPWYAMHADFWNSWQQPALDEYVNECLKTRRTDRPAGCGLVLNKPRK